MNHKVIKYYLVFLFVFFSWAGVASASVEITKVNSNPTVKTDHLWIEVHNISSESIDLTTWSVADYDSEGKWHFHAINAHNSNILNPNSFAVIAKASSTTVVNFVSKNPDITEQLFYGNLTINNEGTIGLSSDGKNIINQINYVGDYKDNTTPSNTLINEDNSETTTSNTSTGTTVKEPEPEVFKITTKIIAPKTVTAGIPFSFSSLTTTNTGKTYAVGRFSWNFGNGDNLEVRKSEPFDYEYEYPGEYIVALSYFDSSFSEVADATNRVTIKVVPSEITISSVGDSVNPFIEIENKSNYEVVLSGWKVTGGIHYFIFPDGTTLLPNKKLKLSPKITGFVWEDIQSVIIKNPSSGVVATYPVVKIKKPTSKSNSTYAIAQNKLPSIEEEKNPQTINLNDLSADAGGANINISKSIYAVIGLIVIIGLGVGSFLMIKRRKTYDDYVEKDIRASDMTIVE